MRLILKFIPENDSHYDSVNKHTIQGFIYSLLNDTGYSNYHDSGGFKYFSYSNIFPVSDFKKGEIKNLIISSPKPGFIRTLVSSLESKEHFYLGKLRMKRVNSKPFNPTLTSRFITSTPIVLHDDNRKNHYYSLKNTNDFSFFLERLKDNSLKKYNAYYNLNYHFDGNLFDRFEYDREVAVRVKKADNMFLIIGTLWKNLEKFNMDDKRFYRFLMDCGLGEKNSLGFGMINSVG
ncbi:MAG: CRISPR-associated endoribonuclease Cas6 [Methanobacterium sp.]|uniref:CRISPR-associated endoribonuclease Cas6 n=1 Tax=Methanobacterium subterraneum TaxID=59277 RepID=A0A7K4DLB8_9EURY|nr:MULTISPECIES: CRISPR-associated endoribonuclease Cas6 [Methanobacterium]MBW4257247.1 CRISPR-associated endoribonuclease Cas6 [Methanobacterium sp. YSL]MCC7561058.1 CRISPR-associated endoribonuclease Cas6 [Methanobacterium sp.]NMO08585.1 CRISPR-associated endoribonuclease Cas6 [Methanobacterium subterraneum]